MCEKLSIGIVGLSFGGEFPPIYRDHPNIGRVVLCDSNLELLNNYANKFHFNDKDLCQSFDGLLEMSLDAIHIITPIHTHELMTIKALDSGHHVASTVPMATSIDGIQRIIDATKKSGKRYMMMETSIYTYQCLFVEEMIRQNKIGHIQYMSGTHFQDMEGWPDYWQGLPPMHYATHAVAPLLYLSQAKAVSVHCFGSGKMRPALNSKYNNPFPVETAIIKLDSGLVVNVTRSLFETAREYVEGFSLLGDKKSFEWHMENEAPYLFEFDDINDLSSLGKLGSLSRGRKISANRINCPDYKSRLPQSIQKYTKQHTVLDPSRPHLSIRQGGGHHGSHPHMVHEFIRSIIENRQSVTNEKVSANWTATGICAHESAMHDGAKMIIPDFN